MPLHIEAKPPLEVTPVISLNILISLRCDPAIAEL